MAAFNFHRKGPLPPCIVCHLCLLLLRSRILLLFSTASPLRRVVCHEASARDSSDREGHLGEIAKGCMASPAVGLLFFGYDS